MNQSQATWIGCFVVNVILIILSIWLTASSALYTSRSSKKKNFEKNSKRLLRMATLASVLTLPRLISTNLLFWIGYNDDIKDQTCEILLDISVVAIIVTFAFVYLFLWLRQHYIYKQPSITAINTKTVRILSWTCFIYIIFGTFVLVFLFVKDAGHQSTPIGCFARRNVTNINETASFNGYYFSAVGVVLAQISVFALLVYPLIRHWNLRIEQTNIQTSSEKHSVAITRNLSSNVEHEESRICASISQTTNENTTNTTTTIESKKKTPKKSRRKSSETSSMQRIHRVIKRNATCALGCIISDLSVQIVNGVIGDTQPRYFTNTILDISIVLNIVFFIRSFDNYKNILFSLFKREYFV